MSDRRLPRHLVAVSLLGLAAACATSPEQCDPNAIGIGGALRCGGDMYEARLSQKREELASIMERTEIQEARADALQQEAQLLAQDRTRLNEMLQSLQNDIDRARLTLQGSSLRNEDARQRNAALEEELAELERQAASLGTGQATEEKIAREMKEIERKKAAMREFSTVPIF